MTLPQAVQAVERYRLKSESVVFTNGVFDLLHTGHLQSLASAKALGNRLVVGINSDASVKRLKGPNRPVQTEHTRALVLASLLLTDAVVLFEEETPLTLVQTLMPDVLVKGGDYTLEQIIGAQEVLANGGRVEIIPIVAGFSTTQTIQNMNK